MGVSDSTRAHTRGLLLLLFVVAAHVPAAGAHSLEVGGGIHIPFASQERSVYGTATAWSFGFTTPLSSDLTRTDVRLMLDVTYSSASGNRVPSDPTFDTPSERYWFLPIVVGVRTNFVRSELQEFVGLFGGVGFASVLSGYRDFNGQTQSTASVGGLVELRPEFTLSEALSIWIRQRIVFIREMEFNGTVPDLNFNGATLQLGLSYKLR